jgi:YfiH family protein
MNQETRNEGDRGNRGPDNGRGGNRHRKPGGEQAADQDKQQNRRNRPRGGQSQGQTQEPRRESAQSGSPQGAKPERHQHRRPRDRRRGQSGRSRQDTESDQQPRSQNRPAGHPADNQTKQEGTRPDHERAARRRIWLETVDRDSGPWFTARAEGGRPLRFTVLFGSKAWSPLEKAPPLEMTGGTYSRTVQLDQVHGSDVHLVGSTAHAATFPREGDALVTRSPGLALVIATADCVPVMLADRRGTTVAAVHAGWRGIAAGLPGKVVQRMSEAFQIQAGRFLAFIGPSISCQGYRVGEEVVQQVAAALPEEGMAGVLHQETDGPHLDLEAAVRVQLMAAGLHEQSIFGGLPSTDGPEGLFHSHRQSGGTAGRMHSMIYLHVGEEEEPPAEEQKPEEKREEDGIPSFRHHPPRRAR